MLKVKQFGVGQPIVIQLAGLFAFETDTETFHLNYNYGCMLATACSFSISSLLVASLADAVTSVHSKLMLYYHLCRSIRSTNNLDHSSKCIFYLYRLLVVAQYCYSTVYSCRSFHQQRLCTRQAEVLRHTICKFSDLLKCMLHFPQH